MTDSIAMFPFEYVLDHEALEIFCGQLLIRRVAYSDIEVAEDGFSLLAANWCNLMPFEYVTIKLKKGLIRRIVLNPPNCAEFIQELQSRHKVRLHIDARTFASA